jgi:hypothetical protein
MSYRWLAVGMAALLWMFGGCRQTVQRAGVAVFEQVYKIDPTARLTIRNLRGSISIRGADTTDLWLQATKKAVNEEQLKNISVSIEAEGGSVSISTSVLRQKKKTVMGGTGTVDYVLVVPRTMKIARLDLDDGRVLVEGMEGEDVRANVVDGDLTVRDCCGNVHLGIANGDLALSYEHCSQDVFVADAQVMHGNARISVPRSAAFHVRAETETGRIANDFTDMVNVNAKSVQKIDMSVGKNVRSQLSLRVTSGDIRIAAVDAQSESQSVSAVSAGNQ